MCVVKSGRVLEETQFRYKAKNKASFNQYQFSSVCLLCGIEPEDLVYFMVTCEKLEEVHQPFITKLQKLITSHHGSHWWTQLGGRDRDS